MINSEFLNYKNVDSKLNNLSGVIVAPGFGERGIEGKITAVNYVRKNDIPFFGICFGMQMAVIEHSRNVLGLSTANSTEIDRDTKYPVISIMDNQKKIINKGGTMRLGSWRCDLKKGSLAYSVYRKNQIFERHRHRYEYNNDYMKKLEDSGLVATGINPETKLVEIIENINNKWFIGVQYHPEFKSTVLNPHPLFKSFMKASLERFKNSRV
jgi:CTP synthase